MIVDVCVPKTRSRSCRTFVLMNQAAENLPPDHRPRRIVVGGHRRRCGNGRVHVERAMGRMIVVVRDIGRRVDSR
jgi:hypothetical protein